MIDGVVGRALPRVVNFNKMLPPTKWRSLTIALEALVRNAGRLPSSDVSPRPQSTHTHACLPLGPILVTPFLGALVVNSGVNPQELIVNFLQAAETLKAAQVSEAKSNAVCGALVARANELRGALLVEAASIGTTTIRDFDWNVAVSNSDSDWT